MIIAGKDFFRKLNLYLETASKEILISTFKLQDGKRSEHQPLQATLNLLTIYAHRGLTIKLICPGPPQITGIARDNKDMIRRLEWAGVDVRTQSGYTSLHAKLFIIDRRIMAIGSHNLSRGSCACNWEVSIFSEDPTDVLTAATLYDTAWNEMKAPIKKGSDKQTPNL